MNSRELKQKAIRKREEYFNYYMGNFSSLLHNSFTVENENELPKRYLLNTLFKYGQIVYDKETGLYLRGRGIGIDVYGLPTQYTLFGANGYVVTREAKDVVVLRANDLSIPIWIYLKQQSEKIVEYDMAIEQNLEAIKTMVLCGFDSEKNLLSFMNQIESRRLGATACYVNNLANRGTGLKVDSTGAQFLVDKLLDCRKKIIDETYQKMGIQYANTDKKERVQATEVNASLGLAVDSIYTFVDTFNYDAEYGGIPIRLKLNSSLEEIYLNNYYNFVNGTNVGVNKNEKDMENNSQNT